MRRRCKCCGAKYDFDEAAEEFNEYFDGEHDYGYEGWEDYCAECAIAGQEQEDEDGEGYFDD